MAEPLYTAEATAYGGRDGEVKSSDGELHLVVHPPKELGGPGEGTNPEQLFAIGYAACFDNAVSTVARRLKLEPVEIVTESKVSLVANESRGFDLEVDLPLNVPGVEGEQAVELITTA